MKRTLTIASLLCVTTCCLVAQTDFDKFERTGLSAWKRREYQHAINNYIAALTYPMMPDKNQQIRDTVSALEEEYRGFLKQQRNFSRRMERSNELILQAMQAYDLGKYGLALQLAHYACKISNNTNVLALRCRSYYLNNSNFIPPIPPQSNLKNISIIYEISPTDSSKARLVVYEKDVKNKKKEEVDTLDLSIPPIASISLLSDDDKIIALCNNHKPYWVNIKNGETAMATQASNEEVTSIALWNNGDYYALGYKSGKFEIYTGKDGNLLFRYTTSESIKYLDFCRIDANKKGKKISLISSNGPNAVLWEIRYKKGGASLERTQLLSKDVVMAKISRDRKMAALLKKDDGIQFFSGNGKPIGDVKYPFTSRKDDFKVKDMIIADDNESVIFKISKLDYIDHKEIEFTEEIDKAGRIKRKNKQAADGENNDKPVINLRNVGRDNKYTDLNVYQLRFINGGRQFASLTQTQDSVYIANTNPYKITARFGREGTNLITEIAPDPTGKYTLGSTNNNMVYLFNATNNSRIVLNYYRNPVTPIAFSGNADYFLCADREKLYLHNLPNGSISSTFSFTSPITALATSPSGDTIMVGLENGNVLYTRKTQIGDILVAGLGRAVGPVSKVSFSKKGRKSLILSKDKSQDRMVLDVVNNDPSDIGADRRYYYESPDEIDIHYAEFSADDNLVLLTKKNETILLSAKFLKPEYEIQTLKSPHKGDEIKEAYLVENDRFIATISNGGDLWLQINPIVYLDREMEDLSLLEQIKYKVAEPDSIPFNAKTKEELDKSVAYLAEYYANEEDQRSHIRDIMIDILTKRLTFDSIDTKDSIIVGNHYLSLARAYDEQSIEWYEKLEPTDALKKEVSALRCIKEAWKYFQYRADVEKNQVQETMCRIYNSMARLNICTCHFLEAHRYADTSDLHKLTLPGCNDINVSNKALILLLSGQAKAAYELFDLYKNIKCSDQKGNENLKEVFLSDLIYLYLIFKGRGGSYKTHLKAIDAAIKHLK